jgi:FkbM family methyltransferase
MIKDFIPPILYKFFKKNFFKKYYALNDLDKKLEKYLNYNDGYFVELGANDGIAQSNTYFYERKKNWKGILVEPIPHKFLDCIKNRSDKNNIFCNACVGFEFKEKFVEILYSNLMSSAINLKSDIKNPKQHAESGKNFLNSTDNIFKFAALASTLNDLMIKSNAPDKIDLLSLDVEGAEIEVLNGVDFNHYVFKYLLIESRSFDIINNFLSAKNYKFIEKLGEHDYLFGYS